MHPHQPAASGCSRRLNPNPQRHLQDLFSEYIDPRGAADAPGATTPDPGSTPALAFLWLLFLCAKAALLPPLPDLVPSFTLLLACLHFLLHNLAPRHHRAPLGDGDAFPSRHPANGAPDVLLSLAATHRAGEQQAELVQLAAALDAFLAHRLAAVGLHPAPPAVAAATPRQEVESHQQQRHAAPAPDLPPAFAAAPAPGGATHACLLFPGLFEGALPLPAAVQALQDYYHTAVASYSDIEERVFVPGALPDAPGMPARPPPPVAAAGGGGGCSPGAGGCGTPPAGHPGGAGSPATSLSRMRRLGTTTPGGTERACPAAGAATGAGAERAAADAAPPAATDSGPFCTPTAPRLLQLDRTPGSSLGWGRVPMGGALASVGWLRGLVVTAHGPSPALEAALQQCGDAGLGSRLATAAAEAVEAVLPLVDVEETWAGQPLDAAQLGAPGHHQQQQQQRRQQAIALYWRLLDRLAACEAARALGGRASAPGASLPAAPAASGEGGAHVSGATAGELGSPRSSNGSGGGDAGAALPSSPTSAGSPPAAAAAAGLLAAPPAFHRSMLACALECAAAAHRMPSLAFPAVLDRLGVQPFDLSKLVPEVVRAEPGLPRCVLLSSPCPWGAACCGVAVQRSLAGPLEGVGRELLLRLAVPLLAAVPAFGTIWPQLRACPPTEIGALGNPKPWDHIPAMHREPWTSSPAHPCSPLPDPLPPCACSCHHRRELRRHLLSVEERTLECLAWRPGSSLYPTLLAACGPAGHDTCGIGGGGSTAPRQAGARGPAGGNSTAGPSAKRQRCCTPDGSRADSNSRQGSPQAAAPAIAAGPRLPLCFGPQPTLTGGAPACAAPPTASAAGPDCSGGGECGDAAAAAACSQFLHRMLHLASCRLADLLDRLRGQVQPRDPGVLLAQVRQGLSGLSAARAVPGSQLFSVQFLGLGEIRSCRSCPHSSFSYFLSFPFPPCCFLVFLRCISFYHPCPTGQPVRPCGSSTTQQSPPP